MGSWIAKGATLNEIGFILGPLDPHPPLRADRTISFLQSVQVVPDAPYQIRASDLQNQKVLDAIIVGHGEHDGAMT
jgi:hypothetical protein